MEKKTFLLLLFLAAIGLTTGCFFELYLSGEGKDQLIHQLADYFGSDGTDFSYWQSFWQNLRRCLPFFCLCFLSPLLPVLCPVDLTLIFLRGFFLGFTCSMVIETFSIKGIFYASITLVPWAVMQIMLFAELLTFSFIQAGDMFYPFKLRHRHASSGPTVKKYWSAGIRKALQLAAGPYLFHYTAAMIFLILIGLLQSFLLQAVLSP